MLLRAPAALALPPPRPIRLVVIRSTIEPVLTTWQNSGGTKPVELAVASPLASGRRPPTGVPMKTMDPRSMSFHVMPSSIRTTFSGLVGEGRRW